MQISEPGKELNGNSLLLAADSSMSKVTEQKGHQEPASRSGASRDTVWRGISAHRWAGERPSPETTQRTLELETRLRCEYSRERERKKVEAARKKQ